MFAYEFDFNNLRRYAIMGFATLIALFSRNVWALVVLAVAAYFAVEAHHLYPRAKSYKQIAGHIKKAANFNPG